MNPLPHNALHVRITKSDDMGYQIEVSTDQLLWFALPDSFEEKSYAIAEADLLLHSQRFQLQADRDVVWEDGEDVPPDRPTS